MIYRFVLVSRRRKNEVESTDESEVIIALHFYISLLIMKKFYRRLTKCTKTWELVYVREEVASR